MCFVLQHAAAQAPTLKYQTGGRSGKMRNQKHTRTGPQSHLIGQDKRTLSQNIVVTGIKSQSTAKTSWSARAHTQLTVIYNFVLFSQARASRDRFSYRLADEMQLKSFCRDACGMQQPHGSHAQTRVSSSMSSAVCRLAVSARGALVMRINANRSTHATRDNDALSHWIEPSARNESQKEACIRRNPNTNLIIVVVVVGVPFSIPLSKQNSTKVQSMAINSMALALGLLIAIKLDKQHAGGRTHEKTLTSIEAFDYMYV